MRKIITSVVLISSFLMIGNIATSCSKVEDIIDDITVPVPFTIPLDFNAEFPFAIDTGVSLTSPELPVSLDVNQKIKDYNSSLSIDNLKSARLDKFVVEAAEGNTVPLDAIKDAEVYFKTPNVGEVLVAKVAGNTNPTSITFTPTSEDLINHLKTNQHTFYLKITGGKLAAGNMKIKVNTGFRISVGL
ncbi:hypothetical protein LUD75_00230 [Epilithonimonas sp. JDS]|uniref:hypothetical protein n=1 Tax=Epilithonimonas sp. JDS TaxID=2902797 RepID=UPI001E5DF7F0|nr:hypothetical protein [Epilithonimonas sp. JDS]MCD9853114.1 hypothetical protein [Epilithonimonas sp. JDS]